MTMFRDSRLQPWLLSLLCVALLTVRVGGAHLHLCFDGKEPPKAFHWADSGDHHGGNVGADAPHRDADIALAGDLIGKSGKQLFDLPLFLLAVILPWLLMQPGRRHATARFIPVAPTAPLFLRPPLRGPPPLSSH